jgi:N-glycosylase/DNA lyase
VIFLTVTELKREIEHLEKKIGKKVRCKLKEFEKNSSASQKKKFLELCFCILVANSSVKKTQEICDRIGEKFFTLSEKQLKFYLKKYGQRFYNKRARYIVLARKHIGEIDAITKNKNEQEAREWLVENIPGISWKEASHFLRNVGFKNFALLDRHIMKILQSRRVLGKNPSTLSKKQYFTVERQLKNIADSLGITLAELDLYLFYLDANRICER